MNLPNDRPTLHSGIRYERVATINIDTTGYKNCTDVVIDVTGVTATVPARQVAREHPDGGTRTIPEARYWWPHHRVQSVIIAKGDAR